MLLLKKNLCTGFPPLLLNDEKGSELNQAVFSAPVLVLVLFIRTSNGGIMMLKSQSCLDGSYSHRGQ